MQNRIHVTKLCTSLNKINTTRLQNQHSYFSMFTWYSVPHWSHVHNFMLLVCTNSLWTNISLDVISATGPSIFTGLPLSLDVVCPVAPLFLLSSVLFKQESADNSREGQVSHHNIILISFLFSCQF